MAAIKPGTYRLCDILSAPSGNIEQNIKFTIKVGGEEATCAGIKILTSFDYNVISVYYLVTACDALASAGLTLPAWCTAGEAPIGEFSWNDSYGDTEGLQYITIPEWQVSSEEFGLWFASNTYMACMPGKTGVTIEWDGNTDGLVAIPNPIYPEATLYRVSDRRFTLPELCEWAYWERGDNDYYPGWSSYSYVDDWAPEMQGECLCILKAVWIVTKSFRFEGATIPVGVYFSVDPDNMDRAVKRLLLPNANETADEPSASGATISYNGSIIASLVGGQTATLKCKGMKMESDVVVEMKGDGLLV